MELRGGEGAEDGSPLDLQKMAQGITSSVSEMLDELRGLEGLVVSAFLPQDPLPAYVY